MLKREETRGHSGVIVEDGKVCQNPIIEVRKVCNEIKSLRSEKCDIWSLSLVKMGTFKQKSQQMGFFEPN